MFLSGLGNSGTETPTQRRDSFSGATSDYKRSLSMSQFYGSSPQLGPFGMSPTHTGSMTPPPSQSTLSGLGLGEYLESWNLVAFVKGSSVFGAKSWFHIISDYKLWSLFYCYMKREEYCSVSNSSLFKKECCLMSKISFALKACSGDHIWCFKIMQENFLTQTVKTPSQ